MRHIISVLMENEPGALSRVVGLFSQRGYNIESLNVAPTEDSSLSRLTLTTIGDDRTIEQIERILAAMLKLQTVNEARELLKAILERQSELKKKTEQERKRKLLESL